MNSTVTKSNTMLPGFDNVAAEQRGPVLHLLIKDNPTVHTAFNRNEYDCDPSFVYDVNTWAVRNGGVRTPQ